MSVVRGCARAVGLRSATGDPWRFRVSAGRSDTASSGRSRALERRRRGRVNRHTAVKQSSSECSENGRCKGGWRRIAVCLDVVSDQFRGGVGDATTHQPYLCTTLRVAGAPAEYPRSAKWTRVEAASLLGSVRTAQALQRLSQPWRSSALLVRLASVEPAHVGQGDATPETCRVSRPVVLVIRVWRQIGVVRHGHCLPGVPDGAGRGQDPNPTPSLTQPVSPQATSRFLLSCMAQEQALRACPMW